MREGKIRVNGAKVKQNYRIQAADELTMPDIGVVKQPDDEPAVPGSLVQQIRRAIIFENRELIVVNKPADVAVHRGTGVAAGVIEALRHARPEIPELELVHRLDRETSGVLLVAKTSSMLRHLQNLLRENQQDIKRHYLLVVHGQWPERKRRSLAKLLRTGSRTVVNESQGQPAETHFRVVRKLGQHATLLQAQLITGRKHQIRVHCQHEGHPIAGDSRYGLPEFNRWARRWGTTAMMLHAHRVEVPMPDGQVLDIEAPTPHYFQRIA